MTKMALLIWALCGSLHCICTSLPEFWKNNAALLKANNLEDLIKRADTVKIGASSREISSDYDRITVGKAYTLKSFKLGKEDSKRGRRNSIVTNQQLLAELMQEAKNYEKLASYPQITRIQKFHSCATEGDNYLFLYDAQWGNMSQKLDMLLPHGPAVRYGFYAALGEAYIPFENNKIAHNNFNLESIQVFENDFTKLRLCNFAYCIFPNTRVTMNKEQINQPRSRMNGKHIEYYSDMPSFLIFVIISEYLAELYHADNHLNAFFQISYHGEKQNRIIERYCTNHSSFKNGVKSYLCDQLSFEAENLITFSQISGYFTKLAQETKLEPLFVRKTPLSF